MPFDTEAAYSDASDAITNVQRAAAALGAARADECDLEDQRAIVKMEGVKRIMQRDGLAATPAEKIIETDELYATHRAKQRAAVLNCQQAWGEFEAAKLRAELAIARYRALTQSAAVAAGVE